MARGRPPKVKPVIPTMIRTEFGEVLESEAFHAATGAQGDNTYVPGYSDLRRERDIAIREVAQRKRQPQDTPTLPVRLQWVRTVNINNTPDNRKSVSFGNQGYRPVRESDVGAPWLKALPEGATITAGGEIRQGDVTLMMVDAHRAARNSAAVAYRTQQMMRPDTTAGDLLRLGESKPGSDPSFQVTPGEQITVGSSIKGR